MGVSTQGQAIIKNYTLGIEMEYSYIKKVRYAGNHQVHCVFENGLEGLLDLTPYRNRGGVFKKMKNESYIKKISLINGVLSWGNGELDIAPETVYSLVTKAPLPTWMIDNA
jgi:hypothetical protein